MVTALVARWQLGAELYRETGDTDLGVPPVVVRDEQIIERLLDLGYEKIAGNRFGRTTDDVPIGLTEGAPERHAIIDVLIPSYTRRIRGSREVGDKLVTTEVPGLAFALKREPVTLHLSLRRLNEDRFDVALAFPDEVAALGLKAFATTVRRKATDIVDVWRCMEIAFAAGVQPSEFADGEPAEASAIVRALFDGRTGDGMDALVDEQRLTIEAADQRFTRIRALIDRVLGGR